MKRKKACIEKEIDSDGERYVLYALERREHDTSYYSSRIRTDENYDVLEQFVRNSNSYVLYNKDEIKEIIKQDDKIGFWIGLALFILLFIGPGFLKYGLEYGDNNYITTGVLCTIILIIIIKVNMHRTKD